MRMQERVRTIKPAYISHTNTILDSGKLLKRYWKDRTFSSIIVRDADAYYKL